jgi:hypothetical protein
VSVVSRLGLIAAVERKAGSWMVTAVRGSEWRPESAVLSGMGDLNGEFAARFLRTEGLIEASGTGAWTITQAGRTFMTTAEGCPIAVEVYAGNTADERIRWPLIVEVVAMNKISGYEQI